jgi:transposase
MMGLKVRRFEAHVAICLEDLVPGDNFYRQVEAKLDLSFVRDFVKDKYSAFGRPSIDPVVFFKLQLVMFFEGLRSERQLVQVAADRLSVRWYLGYDLHEVLPEHSSMTRIRDRYGVAIFRRSSIGLSNNVNKPGSSGARSCTRTQPLSMQMPTVMQWCRASLRTL